MTAQEYFGDWVKVIPKKELSKVMDYIKPIKDNVCPDYKDIFKAFRMCPYKNLRVIIIGADPYPQKGIATGIAFANKQIASEQILSPSLQVIKESVIDYEIPHNLITFAPTLEDWEEQGILMLNSALTCLTGRPGSHCLLWRAFTSKLIENICLNNTGIVFLLLGQNAKSFRQFINSNQCIIEEKHPSYYSRKNLKMPHHIWQDINDFLIKRDGYGINFYKEENYGNNQVH